MSISIQIRKETKFKVKENGNRFKLDIEVLDPEWAEVYVNGKFMNLGTFSFEKDVLLLTADVEKGTEIKVRDFQRVGNKSRKQIRKEEEKI